MIHTSWFILKPTKESGKLPGRIKPRNKVSPLNSIFNHSERLSLDHRDTINGLLANLGHGLSEYCFSNLFLFRDIHHYELLGDSKKFLTGKTYDDHRYLMPLFNVAEVTPEFLQASLDPFDFYFPIHPSDLVYFPSSLFSGHFNRDDTDYIFEASKLQSYPGRNLSAKRNLMKQFQERHTFSFSPVSAENKEDALEVLDEWFSDVGKPVDETDYHPCVEALENMEVLGLFGIIYYTEKEPCGFLLAKENIPEMCVFHFAKGKRRFKGVFQFMFNHFANQFKNRFTHYNFEQDLGKENFRRTKLSYAPDMLVHKYRVSRK